MTFFSSCKAAWVYQKAAGSHLWRQLSFTLGTQEGVGKLAVWLANHKEALGSLELTATSTSAQAPELAQHMMLLLGALAGSAVSSLALAADAEVHLGGWLCMLPRLVSLSVSAGKVVVGGSLTDLSGLTGLKLSKRRSQNNHSPVSFGTALALPPRLAALALNGFDAATLELHAMPAGALSCLQSLSLHAPSNLWDSVVQWDGLAAQRQLTRLQLVNWGLEAVPQQLAALTALKALVLEGNAFNDAPDDVLDPLAALLQLTYLSLSNNLLRTVPQPMLLLPSLQVRVSLVFWEKGHQCAVASRQLLHSVTLAACCARASRLSVELALQARSENVLYLWLLQDLRLIDNIIESPLSLTSTTLTRLDLDVDVAVTCAPTLPGLQRLHTLCLHEPNWVFESVTSKEAAHIIQAAMKIPGFAVLDAKGVVADPDPFIVASTLLRILNVINFRILPYYG
jgi:hypothetical protein